MSKSFGSQWNLSRRDFSIATGVLVLQWCLPARAAAAAQTLAERFDYLSTRGNSSCSAAFTDSIAKLPVTTRLQGSCCSPMDRNQYVEQVQGLEKYRSIPEIPHDPYDIPVSLAQKAMLSYDLVLSPEEMRIYQYASEKSDEKGPCCCKCWRWRMYGGLGKFLIRERHFTANSSPRCGTCRTAAVEAVSISTADEAGLRGTAWAFATPSCYEARAIWPMRNKRLSPYRERVVGYIAARAVHHAAKQDRKTPLQAHRLLVVRHPGGKCGQGGLRRTLRND